MDEITVDNPVYFCLDYFSHEGEALMEGAARSGFFIELKKTEKQKNSIVVIDGQDGKIIKRIQEIINTSKERCTDTWQETRARFL